MPFAQDPAESALSRCTHTSGTHRPRGRPFSQPSGERTRCRLRPVAACNLGCELTSWARRLRTYDPALQLGKHTTRPSMHSARVGGGVGNPAEVWLSSASGYESKSTSAGLRRKGFWVSWAVIAPLGLPLFPSRHCGLGGCEWFWCQGVTCGYQVLYPWQRPVAVTVWAVACRRDGSAGMS